VNLKILFVIDGVGSGGAERSLAQMLPYLDRVGIKSTVAFFDRHADSLESSLRAQGTDLRHLPQQGVMRRVAALRRLILTEQPHVVHTSLFQADVIGRLASIGLNKVVISSLVNTSYDPIRLQNNDINPLKLWIVRQLDSWTARHLTNHFHAVSEAVKTAAIETLHLAPAQITVIERGRNNRLDGPNAARRAKTRTELGLEDSDELIISVGRQEYQKGQQYLIEAMDQIVRGRPRARLVIAGARGRQSETLEAVRIRYGLADRVRLLGHRDDIPDLLAASDVFAFPSLYEGAAGALLEAMAMGLPIVASKIPAIEHAVEEGQNALLVERATVEPLASAIITILSDTERARAFGRRSREIFEERFTLDRCTQRMIEFYKSLAHGRSSDNRGPRRVGNADVSSFPVGTSVHPKV
jgi:glycosyltransferase involved in cell wall biosynthesis